LRSLVPPERAAGEAIERARRYQGAGCDGIFVPGLADPGAIRDFTAAINLPLNVLVLPRLPRVAELRELGVRRVSSGSALTRAAYAIARRAATEFLTEGRYDAIFETTAPYAELNALYSRT